MRHGRVVFGVTFLLAIWPSRVPLLRAQQFGTQTAVRYVRSYAVTGLIREDGYKPLARFIFLSSLLPNDVHLLDPRSKLGQQHMRRIG
jgi:hypothetical protein